MAFRLRFSSFSSSARANSNSWSGVLRLQPTPITRLRGWKTSCPCSALELEMIRSASSRLLPWMRSWGSEWTETSLKIWREPRFTRMELALVMVLLSAARPCSRAQRSRAVSFKVSEAVVITGFPPLMAAASRARAFPPPI